MFVYGPALLLDGTIPEIALSFTTAIAGVTAFAAAAIGYTRRPLPAWERVLLGAGALALVFPGLMSDGAGLVVLSVVFFRAE
jgi:TRAP-type uncharacterized transport system fused permease subunit